MQKRDKKIVMGLIKEHNKIKEFVKISIKNSITSQLMLVKQIKNKTLYDFKKTISNIKPYLLG